MDELKTGVIKEFVPRRGFGFIKTDSGDDMFFHISAVADWGLKTNSLMIGDRVTFLIGEYRGKQKAVNIVVREPILKRRVSGEVRKIIKDGNYGFIRTDNDLIDVYFHESDLENISFDELNMHDRVNFLVRNQRKGPYAIDIMAEK